MTRQHSRGAIERARVFESEGDRPRQNSLALDAELPAVGLDLEGMPPVQRLASLEEQARHRLSPRKPLWAEVATFEARIGDLEARHRQVLSDLRNANGQLGSVDQRDAAALAQWELDGRSGEKPEAEKSGLQDHVAELERERDGLAGAIAQVLADKAAYVQKHRSRLTATASRLVNEAKARYVQAVEQMAAARAELVELRQTELWAHVFPDEAAFRMPRADHLALGASSQYPPGLADRALSADGVLALLRTDAEAVAGSMSTAQRIVIQGLDPNQPPNTYWTDSDEAREASKADLQRRREAYMADWGRVPGW
jgi:hypothetical protein